jgi:hypothetical protein
VDRCANQKEDIGSGDVGANYVIAAAVASLATVLTVREMAGSPLRGVDAPADLARA